MFDISKKFQVQIPGRGALALGPNDHVASGGEGHVYRKGGIAVKVWDDPGRAAQGRMPEKVKLLAELKHPFVVAPEALALDGHGKAIGIVMPWVANSWALPLAFTNDWRSANGFGDADALAFAAKMREVVAFAHSKGAVLGDANELNVLGVGKEPRYIDVDPWVLPGFPGDKVLPTIYDWHSAPFSREADWFAWAAVTFQLLVGIHPYRGTHPGFKRNDVEGRMKANASVFDSRVRLNPAVRPFASVPAQLLDWYRAVFADGFRGAPPDPQASPARAAPRAAVRMAASGSLKIAEAFGLASPLLRSVAPDVLLLEDGSLLSLPDGRAWGRGETGAAYQRMANGALAGVDVRDGKLRFGTLHPAPGARMGMAEAGLAASAVWSAENRLFAVAHDGLLEVQVRDLGNRYAPVPGRKWSLNPNATSFGDGVALFDALGAKYLVAPFGPSAVAVLRARELDGLRPVSMVRRGRVATMSLIDKAGAYHRATVLFAGNWTGCQIAVADADDGSLSDAITDSGVVVRFDADGKLDLAVPATGAAKQADAGGAAAGRLLAGPSGVFCAVGGKVFKLSLS